MAPKRRGRRRNDWWQLIAFLMKTFKMSIDQIAQMDLVQIHAIVEGHRRLYGQKSVDLDELEELIGHG